MAGDREPVNQYQPSTDREDDQSSADHYLIALKDHTIYSVVAYWVDGDTLHYFTAGNVHNQASLSLVDRDLTARLNKESGMEVNLPPAAK
jgi:endonuclease YncB( thermonuclease family)